MTRKKMSSSITLNLPDDVYRRAESLAQLMRRDLGEVLVEAISLSLSPITPAPAGDEGREDPSVSSLSDREVLALAESQMNPDQERQLSELLDRQQAGTLTEAERPELWTSTLDKKGSLRILYANYNFSLIWLS